MKRRLIVLGATFFVVAWGAGARAEEVIVLVPQTPIQQQQSLAPMEPSRSPASIPANTDPGISRTTADPSSGRMDALKTAVIQTLPQLNLTQAWQRQIFEQEVEPQYQRFIRGYRTTDTGALAIDVDLDNIRTYLSFYAPKALNRQQPKVLLFVRADEGCAKCEKALAPTTELMKARLVDRGFVVQEITDADLGQVSFAGTELESRVTQKAIDTDAGGALVVQLGLAPRDPDSHESQEYLVQTFMLARGAQELRHSDHKEVLYRASLENTAERLLTDAFLDFGKRASLIGQSDVEEKGMIQLTLSGITDFRQFSKVRTALEDGFKGDHSVRSIEERTLARGQVTFSLKTEKSPAQLMEALSALSTDGVKFVVKGSGERSVQAEVHTL